MAQKKFKYPLIIEGDWQSLLPALEALGYRKEVVIGTSDVLVTNSVGINGLLCSYPVGDKGFAYDWRTSRIKVDAADRDLVLALAAALEGEETHKGEAYVFQSNGYSGATNFTRECIYFLAENSLDDSFAFTTDTFGTFDGFGGKGNREYFRKATKEEIFDHFEKKKDDSIGKLDDVRHNRSFVISEEPIETTVPARISFLKELYEETYSLDNLRENLEEEFPTVFPPAPPVTFAVGETIVLFNKGMAKLMIIGTSGPEGLNEIALLDIATGRVNSDPVQVDDTTKITEEEILEAGEGYGLTACNYAKFCTE